MTKSIPRIAVVGAGISGLSATRELLRCGLEVCLFESSERAGGLLDTFASDGFMMERAAGSFVPADSGAAELARELGVPLEEASPTAKKRWVYHGGQLCELPSSPGKMLSSSFLSWRGKLRALAEPLQPTRPGADESIAEFFQRRLGDEVASRLVAPFVTGVFAGDSSSLSLRACFPSLSTLEGRGGLLRGLAATRVESAFGYFQEEGGRKKGRRILAPVGGLGALTKALATELEPHIRYSTSISSIEKDEEGFVLYDHSGQSRRFDGVVLATPAYVSASLVSPHRPEMAQALREIPYVPMAVAGLGYTTALKHPLDGFGFLVAKGEALRLLGVVFESSCFSGRAPEGGVLLRCMMGGARDPDILNESNETILARAREDLKKVLGIEEDPSFQKVVRWPRAIPQYTIGHLEREERIESAAESLGIVVTGNALGGVSVNDCLAKGKKVAKRIIEIVSRSAPMLLAMAVALGAACGSKTQVARDSGIPVAARAPADAEVASQAPHLPSDKGEVAVRARWLWPDAALRRSPGRNQCGQARDAALKVELMGGLHYVAVTSEGGQSALDAELVVSGCKIAPKVVVMGPNRTLTIVNLDERAQSLIVEELGKNGQVLRQVGTAPMHVPGQVFRYSPKRATTLRIHERGDPLDFSYVVVHKGAASVTDMRGYAQLELPVGDQKISLWYPPVFGHREGVSAELQTEVVAKVRSKHVVDMAGTGGD